MAGFYFVRKFPACNNHKAHARGGGAGGIFSLVYCFTTFFLDENGEESYFVESFSRICVFHERTFMGSSSARHLGSAACEIPSSIQAQTVE